MPVSGSDGRISRERKAPSADSALALARLHVTGCGRSLEIFLLIAFTNLQSWELLGWGDSALYDRAEGSGSQASF